MSAMIILSLVLNIAVLIPVCTGLMIDAGWAQESYGEVSPARGILLSIYLAILVSSVLMLVFRDPKSVALLLFLQIIYKLTTPLTVGSIQNPVVISNLVISAVHFATLLSIWRTVGFPFGK